MTRQFGDQRLFSMKGEGSWLIVRLRGVARDRATVPAV